MGEEINIKKIECYRDLYQIDLWYAEQRKGERLFIRKDALLALIAVAEKDAIEGSRWRYMIYAARVKTAFAEKILGGAMQIGIMNIAV